MKQFAIIFLFLFLSLPFMAQDDNMTYHRARIYYDKMDELSILSQIGLEIDHGLHKKGVFVESDYAETELEKAQNAGFEIEIIIEDVQAYYVNQNKIRKVETRNPTCGQEAFQYPQPVNYELGSMGGFFTYEEILAELDEMAALYPNLITPRAQISDFETFEERPIYWLRMSDNPTVDEDEPEMMYNAVHHAREAASVSTLIYYMWYLLENYDTSPEVQSILDNSQLYFVPVVNPDGYIYNVTTNPNGGGLWRKNRRDNLDNTFGIDNNRNYGIEWGTTGVSFDTESNTYPGTEPFSEVENQAMKWFCENNNFLINYNNHSYSNLLLYPFGYELNTPTPDHNYYIAISEELVSQNGFTNQLAAALYPASGNADDWMYTETPEKGKIYSFTPEIGSPSQGFWPAEDDILDLSNSTMYMNLTAAHMITKYAVVADNSPNLYEDINNTVDFNLKRLGLQDASFTVSISPVTANINATGASVTFDDLAILEIGVGTIDLILENSIAVGDEIQFNLIVDNGGYTTNTLVTKHYGQEAVEFADDGETMSNWSSGDWATTSAQFVSAPSSFTDSPGGNYSNNEITTIQLNNQIDLTDAGGASLSYYAKWSIEAGWDFVQVQISIDDGVSWIAQCGNYTHLGNEQQAENEPLYDGFQNTWIPEYISLSDYLGESILVRFILVSDNFTTFDGFYFDDMEVNAIIDPTGISEKFDNNDFTVEVFPNPVMKNELLNLDIENTNISSIIIKNTQGQEIDRIAIDKNLKNFSYNTNKLNVGAYFLSFMVNGKEVASRQFVVLK